MKKVLGIVNSNLFLIVLWIVIGIAHTCELFIEGNKSEAIMYIVTTIMIIVLLFNLRSHEKIIKTQHNFIENTINIINKGKKNENRNNRGSNISSESA